MSDTSAEGWIVDNERICSDVYLKQDPSLKGYSRIERGLQLVSGEFEKRRE